MSFYLVEKKEREKRREKNEEKKDKIEKKTERKKKKKSINSQKRISFLSFFFLSL